MVQQPCGENRCVRQEFMISILRQANDVHAADSTRASAALKECSTSSARRRYEAAICAASRCFSQHDAIPPPAATPYVAYASHASRTPSPRAATFDATPTSAGGKTAMRERAALAAMPTYFAPCRRRKMQNGR